MATDEGFFGPSSVSWRIHRDASAILGAGRALLVQALEPHVMDVFLKNTDYRDDPWGRLRRTGDYFGDVIFGDTARAVAAGERVRCLHTRLECVFDVETGRLYRAGDPDLLLWVHATAVDAFLHSLAGSLRLAGAIALGGSAIAAILLPSRPQAPTEAIVPADRIVEPEPVLAWES